MIAVKAITRTNTNVARSVSYMVSHLVRLRTILLVTVAAAAALPVAVHAQAAQPTDSEADSWLAFLAGTSSAQQSTATEPKSISAALPTSQESQPNTILLPELPRLGWNTIPLFRPTDRPVRLRLAAEAQAYFGWIHAPSMEQLLQTDLDDRFQWRRLRPSICAFIGDDTDLKAELEFAEGKGQIKDLFVRQRRIPWAGDLTIGHVKEPFSLEQLMSNTDTTFLERGLPNALSPGRAFGGMLNDSALDDRVTWAAGAFRTVTASWADSSDEGDALAFTGRTTWLPYYEQDGAQLVHLGAAYSYRVPQDTIKYDQRPEAHFTDFFTDTGDIDAQHVNLLGTEAVWQDGPFSLQSQYLAAAVDSAAAGNPFLDGFYVQGSYFLTGEHRPYDKHTGIFTSVQPLKDFLGPGGGLGAWEVAGRYSLLDLQSVDLPSSARDMQDMTLGLNWYLTPNVRIGWNYIHSWVQGSDGSGTADIFVMRLQVCF